MLDFADLVVVNKFEKRGGEDAVRDVRKQVQRNRMVFDRPPEDMPVFGTIASKFNDDGVTALYHALLDTIKERPAWPSNPACRGPTPSSPPPKPSSSRRNAPATWRKSPKRSENLPPGNRKPGRRHAAGVASGRNGQNPFGGDLEGDRADLLNRLKAEIDKARISGRRDGKTGQGSGRTPRNAYSGDELVYTVRGKEIRVPSIPSPSPTRRSPRSPCPDSRIPARFTAGCGGKTCPATFPTPPGSSP
jgi:methylmalonyl-CoA mutase